MISFEKQVVMRIFGLVHVTRLILAEDDLPNLPVIAHPDEYGIWDRAPATRRPRSLLITTEGEVWIKAGDISEVPNFLPQDLCPNGRKPKAYWPTFWALDPEDILARASDPYWKYIPHTPSPEEVEEYCQRQYSIRS